MQTGNLGILSVAGLRILGHCLSTKVEGTSAAAGNLQCRSGVCTASTCKRARSTTAAIKGLQNGHPSAEIIRQCPRVKPVEDIFVERRKKVEFF